MSVVGGHKNLEKTNKITISVLESDIKCKQRKIKYTKLLELQCNKTRITKSNHMEGKITKI